VLLGLLAVAWGVLLLPRLFRGSENGFDVFGMFRSLVGLIPLRRSSNSSRFLTRSASTGMRPITGRSAGGFSGFGMPGSGSGGSGRSTYGVARGRRTNKRRRDVFMGLLFSAIGTAVLALVPGFSMLWKANFVVDALLLGYVALLVSARRPARSRSPLRENSLAAVGYESDDYQLDYARSKA
jgi:hypothetical protein